MKGILFLIILTILTTGAQASFISLQSTINTKVIEDNLEININTTNLGDESAHDIKLEINTLDQHKASDIKNRLGIQETSSSKFSFSLTSIKPGDYPLILTTNYKDLNSHPFSSVSSSIYNYKERTISSIISKIDPIKLVDKATIMITLSNIDNEEKKVSLKLVTPKELIVKNDNLEFTLKGKEQQSINLDIESFSALKGSTYIILAIIEYDQDGIHHTSITNGIVEIVEKKSSLNILLTLGTLLVFLILLMIYFQFKKKK